MTDPLRLAVIGVGSLGRHHARVAKSLANASAAGVFDVDRSRAQAVAAEHGLPALSSIDEAIDRADAVIVATPTVTHHEITARALTAGRHVLVEKPIAATIAEADDLIGRAKGAGRVLQVGQIERFNPAFEAALPHVREPRFLEAHRLGVFSFRSTDVDVVRDLMIHDLHLAQTLVGRPVSEIRAAGVAVLTPTVDIANVRIEFEGGCVANLTASRVSLDKVRKFRVFAPNLYVSMDLAAQDVLAVAVERKADGPSIAPVPLTVQREEPLAAELRNFVAACRGEAEPLVTGLQGRDALDLALAVIREIEEHQRRAS